MRTLSQIEQALTITNISYPLSAVFVLRLRGAPSSEDLQSALVRLQKHYSLLESRIVERGRDFCFEKDKAGRQVKLQGMQRTGDDQWLDLARKELNLGFDHSISPLMRATYLHSSSGTAYSEIILSFHHAIVDAVFLMTFADQMLTLASKGKTEMEELLNSLSKSASLSPLVSEVLPPSFRMPRLFFRMFPFIARQMKNEVVYKKGIGDIEDSVIPASSENDITTVGFTEEETIDLIKWSREKDLSLNSVLSATMLLVVNESNYNSRREMLRAVQFANLRPYLHPPVAKHIAGSFIAMMRFNIPVTNSLSRENKTIQMARQLDNQMRKSVKRGDKFLFFLLSKILIKKSFRDKKERLSATALSYAGPVKLKEKYGSTELTDLHGFITNNCLGPELSGFGKISFMRLSLDLNFLSSETDRDKASQMTEAIKQHLLQLRPRI